MFPRGNQSCILLAKNGRQSSSKRTRHHNLRYFFVKDKIDSGDIVIRYCQTDNPNPNRDFIMNVDPAYYDVDHRSVLKTDSQPANAKPSGHGLDNAKAGGRATRDDSDDPTPYRTALLKRTEGENSE
jgi:hypothetical protein